MIHFTVSRISSNRVFHAAALASRSSGNHEVGIEQVNAGHGLGFTGSHFHADWGNDNVRKAVLNALAWVTKVEVPANGIESKVSDEELKANLDPKPAPKPKKAAVEVPKVFQRVAVK